MANEMYINDNLLNGYLPPSQYPIAMSSTALADFLSQCTTSDIFKNMNNGFTQPLDYINFIRVYPYNVIDSAYSETSVPVVIGNTSISVGNGSLNKVVGTCKSKIHITKEFTSLFGSMSRFSQAYPYVQVDCFLPYVGFVSLDINELRASGNYVKVDLIIDVCSGYGIYSISRYDSKVSGWVVFYTTQTNFAVDISIGGTNGALQSQKIFNNITQATIGLGTMALGVATGNAFALSGGVSSTLGAVINSVNNNNQTVITRGSNGSYPTSFNNPHAIYFIVRSKKVNDYDSFKSFYGKPLNQKKTLSTLSGMTFIPNPKIVIDNITKEEVDLLNNKMKDGIIL